MDATNSRVKDTTDASQSCCAPTCCSEPADEHVATLESASGCGGDKAAGPRPGQEIALTSDMDIHRLVRDRYAQIARAESPGCCGTSVVEDAELLGYSPEQARAIPAGANLGLGCGNPLAHAHVRAGETVLDLGSGAGMDAFLAAREVGPSGRVLGVDMTSDMIERARLNARKVGIDNVEFRLGEIEHLPVADASVDLVISNCVINLSPDKPRVFREALRALRPGGRLVVSDLVLIRPLPPALRASVEAYVGCVAGAALRDDYVQMLRDAGFSQVEVVEEKPYAGCATGASDELLAASDAVVSAKVRAWKR